MGCYFSGKSAFFKWNEHYLIAGVIITDRYTKLGATVNLFDCPAQIKDAKTMERKTTDGHTTGAQRVITYLDNVEPTTRFTREELRNACGITEDLLKSILQKNPHIKKRLDKMRIARGQYEKPA